MTIEELLEVMPGPDFPTGGIVQGLDGIKNAFITGEASSNLEVKPKLKIFLKILIESLSRKFL